MDKKINRLTIQWKPWTAMILVLIMGIVFLYQEPVIQGQKLAIGDVKTQGIIFEKYRNDYQAEFGEKALWYPYIFCGMPFHASGTYRLQYNLETIYKIIPGDILRRLAKGFTFNILAGAIFMLLLLRSYGLGYYASFAGAVAFAFTTKILGTPHTNRIVTFIHLPLILYALRQLWDTRKWIFMVLLGGAVGSQIGSYHPQVAYYGLLMIGLYSLYRLIQGIIEKETWTRLMTTMGMTGVSLGIGYYMASIVLMPMQEYLPFSIRGAGASSGAGGLSFDYATSWSFDWWEIFTFIIPGFSGFGGNTYWGDMPFTSYPHYLGIPVVILALIALIAGEKRRDYWFFVMMLIFSFFIAMGKNFSILSSLLLNYLPYFNKFREPSMILILFAMTTAVLAGCGFQIFLEKITEQKGTEWKTVLIRILIGIGVFSVIVLIFRDGLQNLMFGVYNHADQATERIRQFQSPQQINYLYKMRFDMFYKDMWIAILLSAGTLGLIWAALVQKIQMKPFVVIILILMIADLGYVGRKVIPPMFSKTSRSAMEPRKTGVIDYLKKDLELFRILPLDNFTTNEYSWFGISSVGGYHAAKMANYQDFIDKNFFDNLNFLRLTNTKYTISRKRFNHPELILEQSIQGEHIYRLKNWLPRVFLIDSVVVSQDKLETLNLIRASNFNPVEKAVLTKKIPKMQFNSEGSKVKIEHWKSEKTTISVEMINDALLAFSEGYYPPGWHAYIDGEETEIYQTNHFMQSVMVPAGDHKVEFRFALPSFYRALFISRAIFIAVLIVLLGYGIWINRQRLKLT
jgi:hypothetical protein